MKFNLGDWITIPQKEKNCLGESYNFIVGEPYRIDRMTKNCITMLSGHRCTLSINRDFTLIKQENYEIY